MRIGSLSKVTGRRSRLVRGLLCVLLLAALPSLAWQLWPRDPAVPDSPTTRYLDMHVHVAGIGAGDSGAFVSPSMRDNPRFPFFLWAMDTSLEELTREGDAVLLRKLAGKIERSRRVDAAVVLALDGVIDETGALDRDLTQVYVPNDFVQRETARHEQLYFGASINPYRHDALARLDQAAAQGAVLVKWIPAIMHIDPADPRIVPFYRRMAELEIPLLSHAGQERAFASARDELGDPRRLELPLSLGVTVIAAHVATTGEYGGESSFERLLPLFQRHPELYTEISSLTQVNKIGYLARTAGLPDLEERLLYGSDWPLIIEPLVHPLYQWPDLSLATARAIVELPSPWDRDVAIKEASGIPESVFRRSRALLLD